MTNEYILNSEIYKSNFLKYFKKNFWEYDVEELKKIHEIIDNDVNEWDKSNDSTLSLHFTDKLQVMFWRNGSIEFRELYHRENSLSPIWDFIETDGCNGLNEFVGSMIYYFLDNKKRKKYHSLAELQKAYRKEKFKRILK